MSPLAKPQPEWMGVLRVGDVLLFPGNQYRIVRDVSRWEKVGGKTVRGQGPLRCVTFTIRSTSWTNRCYTVMGAWDLQRRGVRLIGARIKLAGELDRKIDASIHQGATEPYILRARDVRGVA